MRNAEYNRHVQGTRWWRDLIAPFVRPIIRNHNLVIRQGAEVWRACAATLVSEENVDLIA